MDIQPLIKNIIGMLPRADWSIGKRTKPPTSVTLHYNGPAVHRTDDVTWYTFIAQYHMRKDAFGKDSAGDGIMYHYAVTALGEIYHMREDNEILWHCGNSKGNAESIAIELAIGDNQSPTKLQWETTVMLFDYLCGLYDIPRTQVFGHCEWKKTACPGPILFPLLQEWRDIPAVLYDEEVALLHTPRCTPEQAIKYIMSRSTAEYDEFDITENIVSPYFDIGTMLGIDPLLAISQMIHETGNLTSFWSARPQRNPAGIGVNGEWLPTNPRKENWQYNTQRKRWEYGLSFETWKDHAVPAHLARLLGYALTDAEMTPEQLAYFILHTASRPLPTHVRGAAKQLSGLNTRWAVGKLYAASIIKIANAIVRV